MDISKLFLLDSLCTKFTFVCHLTLNVLTHPFLRIYRTYKMIVSPSISLEGQILNHDPWLLYLSGESPLSNVQLGNIWLLENRGALRPSF